MPVQRYEIFCNSQQSKMSIIFWFGCLCRCKDTKFFAIHNRLSYLRPRCSVVYAGAKIRNFLQFTTPKARQRGNKELFMPVQRYEIFCNSQRCCTAVTFCSVVYAGAKIRNFLQFTTS